MTDPVGAAIPLAQAIDEYLDWHALDKACSPNTVRAYKQDLAIFLAYSAAVDVTTLAQVDRELLRGLPVRPGPRPRPYRRPIRADPAPPPRRVALIPEVLCTRGMVAG